MMRQFLFGSNNTSVDNKNSIETTGCGKDGSMSNSPLCVRLSQLRRDMEKTTRDMEKTERELDAILHPEAAPSSKGA